MRPRGQHASLATTGMPPPNAVERLRELFVARANVVAGVESLALVAQIFLLITNTFLPIVQTFERLEQNFFAGGP